MSSERPTVPASEAPSQEVIEMRKADGQIRIYVENSLQDVSESIRQREVGFQHSGGTFHTEEERQKYRNVQEHLAAIKKELGLE